MSCMIFVFVRQPVSLTLCYNQSALLDLIYFKKCVVTINLNPRKNINNINNNI